MCCCCFCCCGGSDGGGVGFFEPEDCPRVRVGGEDDVVEADGDVCEIGLTIACARGDGGLELEEAVGRAVVNFTRGAQAPNLRYGCDTSSVI